MKMPVTISLVSTHAEIGTFIQTELSGHGYQVSCVSNLAVMLGNFYTDPPDLLIVDLTSQYGLAESIVVALRSDIYFSTIPIIGIVSSLEFDVMEWQSCPVDDFIVLPLNTEELLCRIFLSQSRIKRIFDNNPLTRLPGNTSIMRAINDAMGKPMAVCYLDINQFKPYNDVYGFSHGDEVLRMLARIMFNAVRDSGGGFCGHIGGDDFVCIVALERVDSVCQTIIAHYDHIVLDLFDEKTKLQGYFVGLNRKGEIEHIPLLSLSIAVVPTDSPKIMHSAKVVEVAAELKAVAKDSSKSRYVIDGRRN